MPSSAKEIPAKFKQEPWASIGINVADDFQPIYVIPPNKKDVVKSLKESLKQAQELILATDGDREGEGIAWHLMQVLKPEVPTRRMVFHEITKEAIQSALRELRDIDHNLVDAQQARTILDRLTGYTLSPLLWVKIFYGLSAGRVQSFAVKLLVDRERERITFRSADWWDLQASLRAPPSGAAISAQLTTIDGKRIATGRDFNPATGALTQSSELVLLDQNAADALKKTLASAEFVVKKVERRKQSRSPPPPFITSTLQQEAVRKLHMSTKETMQVAQSLYEEGHITYHRTDSTHLASTAIDAARTTVKAVFGVEYLSSAPRRPTGKAKNAQEAHEGIRPTVSEADGVMKHPSDTLLSGRELNLYRLIWRRTVATQMPDADLETVAADIETRSPKKTASFRASGKTVIFPGFLKAYEDETASEDDTKASSDATLPPVSVGQVLSLDSLKAARHSTQPPARYNEASLVQKLEELGVGRPSTYAPIITTVQDRGYCWKDHGALVPSCTAFVVADLLATHFPEIVDSTFTAGMEQHLDAIATGSERRLEYLRSFYCGDQGLEARVKKAEPAIDPKVARRVDVKLPSDTQPSATVYVGKYGPYVEVLRDSQKVAVPLPPLTTPADITPDLIATLARNGSAAMPDALGTDPATGLPVYALTGRYGHYVQLGAVTDDEPKPKRAPLLKGQKMEGIDLDTALALLSLPRNLGQDPETGRTVEARNGPYGPYVTDDDVNQPLTAKDDVLTIGFDRAMELLHKARGRIVHDFGTHPADGLPLRICKSRFGVYLRHGTSKVVLPKAFNSDTATLEQALTLCDVNGTVAANKGKSKSKVKTTASRKRNVPDTASDTEPGTPSATAAAGAAAGAADAPGRSQGRSRSRSVGATTARSTTASTRKKSAEGTGPSAPATGAVKRTRKSSVVETEGQAGLDGADGTPIVEVVEKKAGRRGTKAKVGAS